MKAVIAIDSFKGSLTSLEAGNSVAAGIRRVFPDAECIIRPLADGGEGTVTEKIWKFLSRALWAHLCSATMES